MLITLLRLKNFLLQHFHSFTWLLPLHNDYLIGKIIYITKLSEIYTLDYPNIGRKPLLMLLVKLVKENYMVKLSSVNGLESTYSFFCYILCFQYSRFVNLLMNL